MRALLLFVIGLIFGATGGVLLSGNLGMSGGHDHAGHGGAEHDPSALTAWPADTAVPQLDVMIHPDGDTTRNLEITARGFKWLPDQVNGLVTTPGGHAHVYVNGVKVARAYGSWLQLTDYPEGPVTIRVTFNANDHSLWADGDAPLVVEQVFE